MAALVCGVGVTIWDMACDGCEQPISGGFDCQLAHEHEGVHSTEFVARGGESVVITWAGRAR